MKKLLITLTMFALAFVFTFAPPTFAQYGKYPAPAVVVPVVLTANAGTQTPLTVKAAAAQTANLFEIQPFGLTTPFFSVGASGTIKTGDDAIVTNSLKGVVLKAADSGCWRITVSNAGALTTTSVACP